MFGQKDGSELCPLLKKPCIKHDCQWYMSVMGTNPNTGMDFQNYQCAMVFIPMLLMQNSQAVRQTGSAVQETRNEVAKSRDASNARAEETMKLLLMQLAQSRIEPAKVTIDEPTIHPNDTVGG